MKKEKSCSLADELDLICEQKSCIKCMFFFFYQQHRFAKLGKAAAILKAYLLLQMLLDECNSTNQFVAKACWLYMARELFHSELQFLAYFNHCVTFPFLCTSLQNAQNLAYTVS